VLVALLAWVLAGRALRPVHALTSRVSAIGSHSLHERVPVPASRDEIADLATTMNDMLGRLEASSSTSRRLVSDASHELRTPVTVMRTELEVASRDPNTDWEDTSTVLLLELDRLQGMIDDLLLLARGDERAFARVPVDVVDLIHDVAARRRRVPVGVEIGPRRP
jgi:signal transduction histidine kinase